MPADSAHDLAHRWFLDPHTALHLACLLAAHPQLRVTSGRRTVAENNRAGGAKNSWHLRGRAVDLAGPTALLSAAYRTAQAQRVTMNCTGPEETLHEKKGQRGEHLHVAW